MAQSCESAFLSFVSVLTLAASCKCIRASSFWRCRRKLSKAITRPSQYRGPCRADYSSLQVGDNAKDNTPVPVDALSAFEKDLDVFAVYGQFEGEVAVDERI